ncbi:M50 family metallopeptidase [Paenibacillus montanisoli]|uniref:M50 family peptidase n=1 Tax=Paenibacillus montanisoli TaxID=2081970 RepID=A0A328TZ53_9BACL|nr:M50 family metallopeptidase [Paenibacillus montanisoli]RAP75807.1 M50 family peptidase [Paenibacillus montanisoli]
MNWKVAGYLVLALIIIHLPFIGIFFKIVNTLIHESAHALMALALHGKVVQIQLFSDTSGVTYTLSSSHIGTVLTSLAGYIGSSLFALLLAVLCHRGKHALNLWLFAIISVVNVLLWVRNPFGILWLAAFICLLILSLWRKGKWISAFSIGLFVFVVAESVSSSFVILWRSLYSPTEAGDAANLAEATFLPASVWGVFFMLQACILAFISVKKVLRQGRRKGHGRGASKPITL